MSKGSADRLRRDEVKRYKDNWQKIWGEKKKSPAIGGCTPRQFVADYDRLIDEAYEEDRQRETEKAE